jgi:hypothetical protein
VSHTANVHLFVLVLDLVVGHVAPEMVTGEGSSEVEGEEEEGSGGAVAGVVVTREGSQSAGV